MLKLLRAWRVEIALAFAILLLVATTAYLISPSGHDICEVNKESGKEQCSGNYSAPGFLFLSAAKFVEDHNTLVVALATLVIMIFTGQLVGVGRVQREVTQDQVAHFEVAERAYVQMSHTPPGVNFYNETGNLSIRVKITNKGQTPADILDVHVVGVVAPRRKELPAEPAYRRDEGRKTASSAFLVTDGHFFYYHGQKVISPDDAVRITNGQLLLHIIGYVDYRDVFGKIHRAGYGRTYEPLIDIRGRRQTDDEFEARNNLSFIDQPGYNFDRLRRPGEAWDEEKRP